MEGQASAAEMGAVRQEFAVYSGETAAKTVHAESGASEIKQLTFFMLNWELLHAELGAYAR